MGKRPAASLFEKLCMEAAACAEEAQELEREALSEAVLEAVWARLEGVQIDAKRRHLIWPDGEAFTFRACLKRLRREFPDFPAEEIEAHLIGWIEMEYSPSGSTPEKLAQFERLAEKWVDELEAQQERRRKN